MTGYGSQWTCKLPYVRRWCPYDWKKCRFGNYPTSTVWISASCKIDLSNWKFSDAAWDRIAHEINSFLDQDLSDLSLSYNWNFSCDLGQV
ncbi:hypothetical protein BRADI_3g43772v3 [Brachypodium distachyon]|uniref:Uncharacterized protein n=1 Tax=Brachypodium distachyon TaxID=15368 RepID=A0A2K2D2Z4_BRADI|nr:hypothetical protein BRADI_3g43772v3 [Brachypodium distachyon]